MEYNIKDLENTGIYNGRQLHEIEMGIRNDIDIRYYLGENFDENQMHQIRMLQQFKKETGKKDIEISIIANCNLNYKQMGVIRQAYELGMETEKVLVLANPMLNREQMSQLKGMFLEGISIEDVKNVAFPLYKFEHLWVIREIYSKTQNKAALPDKLFDWNLDLSEVLDLQREIKEENASRKGLRTKIKEIKNDKGNQGQFNKTSITDINLFGR